MRNRLKFGLKIAGTLTLLTAAVAVPVFAQTPQYYPTTTTPAPPGTLPPSNVRPSYGVNTNPGAASGKNNPRLTQPVIAGSDGVRPISATEFDFGKPEMPKLPAAGGPGSAPPMFFPPTSTNSGALPAPSMPAGVPAPSLPGAMSEPKQPTVTAERATIVAPSVSPISPPIISSIAPPSGLQTAPSTLPFNPPSATIPSSIPMAGSLSARVAPNVSVEFEAPESVGVGQSLTYALVVRNTGTAGVSSIRVEEELPTGATFVSSEPVSETTAESRLSWTFGSLEAGGEKRIKITVKVAEEGEIRSRAMVNFAVGVESKVKVTRPKMVLALSGPETARVGDKVPFQIKISNTGTGPAAKVVLQARFSAGLQHPQGEVIEAELQNLAAGASKPLTLEALANKPGQQLCSLTVWADGNPPETMKIGVALVEPQLVAKQTGPARCLVKAEPVYAIELTNPGTASTDPVTAWTVVPEGFEFVAASEGGTFAAANKSVMWKLPGLAANGSKTLTLKLRAVGPTDAVIRTVVQAGVGEATTPGITQVAVKSKTLEARAESPVKSEGVPALRFEVIGSEGAVEVGKEVTYEVKVSNPGTGACSNVQLIVELAESTTATDAKGPTVGRTTGQQILFDPIGSVGVKGEATYRVKVKGMQPGDMRFRVKMTSDQNRTAVVKEENTRFYKE